MTARRSDGSGFPPQYSRFKELLARIVLSSSSDGEVETKQLSCSANSGGRGKTMLVRAWVLSTRFYGTVGPERQL
jgi:hypothetical protein